MQIIGLLQHEKRTFLELLGILKCDHKTLWRHLKALKDKGIIDSESDGTRMLWFALETQEAKNSFYKDTIDPIIRPLGQELAKRLPEGAKLFIAYDNGKLVYVPAMAPVKLPVFKKYMERILQDPKVKKALANAVKKAPPGEKRALNEEFKTFGSLFRVPE